MRQLCRLLVFILVLMLCLSLGASALALETDLVETDLPDPYYFWSELLTHSQEDEITGGKQAVYRLEAQDMDAAYEYVDRLESGRFPVELTQCEMKDMGKGDTTIYYVFAYTGSEDVGEISKYAAGTGDLYGALIVKLNDWPAFGGCEMTVSFADGLTFADTGDRAAADVIGWEGGSLGPIGGGVFSGDGSIISVGQSIKLDCPRRFGANSEQFRWSVLEGEDLVSLDGTISASCTVTALKPGKAIVQVVYDHSYDQADVLTGNKGYGFAAPTYYFEIEIQ